MTRYHIPSHLTAHIDHIRPGITSSTLLSKVAAERTLSSDHGDLQDLKEKISQIDPNSLATCGQYITPACLKAMYGIPNAKYNQSENALGVFGGDRYDQLDLDLSFSHYAP